MSGPVSTKDTPASEHDEHVSSPPTFERIASRATEVGGMSVSRALPRRPRRTIGAWCFLDHFEPTGEVSGMRVGPHPHTGLQTVTWLVEGVVDHDDSLGVHQPIRPGQLNLMTAGWGVSHAEETPTGATDDVRGAQLWIALDDEHRDMEPSFEHHPELPVVTFGDLKATVLVGELGGERSPAKVHSPLMGAALSTAGASSGSLVLDPSFEHGLVALAGAARVGDDEVVNPGELAYLGRGRQGLDLELDPGTELLVVGGEPFAEEPLMWWNFVGRTWDEIRSATEDWNRASERFGAVDSSLPSIPAPKLDRS